jgi:hypothetical protein
MTIGEIMNIYQKVLKQARKRVANREADFICWALEDATYWDDDPDVFFAGERIMEYIQRCLDETYTLESWLVVYAQIPEEHLTQENMRAYRLRFIDHLMEVFENVK